MTGVRIVHHSSRRDARGRSVAFGDLPFRHLRAPRELHAATLVRDAVRGNHLHRERTEILVLCAAGPWSLHWDDDAEGAVYRCEFPGDAITLVEVSPGCSHAVVNHSDEELVLFAASSDAYVPGSGETVGREVFPAVDRETFHVEPPADVNVEGD